MNTTENTSETVSDNQNVAKYTDGVENSTITIDQRYKLEKVVSKDETRAAITVIKLDEHKRFGNCAIATNGRSLAIVPVNVDEGSTNDKGLLSVDALQASRKSRLTAGIMTLNGAIELPDGRKFPRPTEQDNGQYPDVNAILPENTRETKFTIALNPQLLFELSQALGCLKGDGVTLKFGTEMDAIEVTRSHSCAGEYGLLMPMRVS